MSLFRAVPRSVRIFGFTFVASLAATLFAASPADARITRIEIDAARSQSPTFGGYSWPGVGQYEKLVGMAYGEVDPNDPKNAVIVDIELAPRNARGNVEYAFDFYILKPIDLSKGAHKMMYEPPNRGGKTWNALGRVTSSGGRQRPGLGITNPTVLANSFLMPRGYTIVWSGWEDRTSRQPRPTSTRRSRCRSRESATARRSRAPPTSTSCGEHGASFELTYPAATLDKTKATLTHRVHLERRAAGHSRIRLELQRGRNGDQPRRRATSSPTTSTSSRTPRRTRP